MLKTLLTLCLLLSTLTALATDNKTTTQLSKMTKDKKAMTHTLMKFGMQAVLTAQAGKGTELAVVKYISCSAQLRMPIKF
jgi:hypothetical protein